MTTNADETEAIMVAGPCSATDQELAALVGRPVPGSAPSAWSGAYTIIHVQAGQVTLWTDPAGANPIYTARWDGKLVWGSSSRALASLIQAEVDDAWLAAFLADPYADPAGSAFSGIGLVPPGHRLVMAGCRKELTETWASRPLSWSEAVDQLRSALAGGVWARVERSNPAADLSGGMDSTTLAVLAAKYGPVTAVTVHPDGVISGGDLDYARMTAAAHVNIRHVLLPLTDTHLPYGNLETMPATDEPAPSTTTWAMLSAQFQLLADAGVTCHLTGDGGDTLFLQPPVYLTDLVRRGQWLRLARDAQGWARLRRTSPWPLIANAVRGTALTRAALPAPRWLTARAPEPPDLADRDLIARTRFTARTAHTETQLADTYGIAMHNPYLDARVLSVALGVPGWLRGSPFRYKPLLMAATAGLLPESVWRRAAKGTFAGDHHQGLRRNLHQVLDLADGRLAHRGLVSPDQLRSEIRTAAAGLPIHWGNLQRVIAAEVWLRSLDAAAPLAWTTRGAGVRAA